MRINTKPSLKKSAIGITLNPRKSVDVRIVNGIHHLEIIRINGILPKTDIGRYTGVTKCAFLRIKGSLVLAVDMRGCRDAACDDCAEVVVAETRDGKANVPFGFIVNNVNDFFDVLK